MTSGEMARLERLLASISCEVGPSIVLKLAEQFQSKLTQAEAEVYDEAVLRLARLERTEVRARLSCLLALVEVGPIRSVIDLAYDLDPAVAAPVLRQSNLPLEADLITIARIRGQGHLGALAERRRVGAPVTDVVVARGSWPVLRLLAANRTAELSRQALARLAACSRGDGHITVALRKRSDVPAGMKQALLVQFRKMVMAGRPSLCGEHSNIRLDGQAAARSSLRAKLSPSKRENTDPFSAEKLRSAAGRVDAIAKMQPLTIAEVSRRLAQGAPTDTIVMVARLVDQEPECFIQALRSVGALQNLALLRMRRADLSWSDIEQILHEVVAVTNRTMLPNISGQREACADLSRQAAHRAMQATKLQPELRFVKGDEHDKQFNQ